MPKLTKSEQLELRYRAMRERSEREDLVMFINTCFAATQQNEFYTDRFEQAIPIEFLHQYILANYRRVYARILAVGTNHFNQALIIANLLSAGSPSDLSARKEEGDLIWHTLTRLPANRVFGLFQTLQRGKINNRRTRAILTRYLSWRKEPTFDALKYRNKVRSAVMHSHFKLDGELGRFLFDFKNPKKFDEPLIEKYRQAHYSAAAIYDLPFTIAESLAQKHKVPRDVFFRKIQPKMTAAEKLRYQSASDAAGQRIEFDLSRAPLTRLALYLLSLAPNQFESRKIELEKSLQESAARTHQKTPLSLGRVVAILDRSRSSQGSSTKRHRPLAIAIGIDALLKHSAESYVSLWTPSFNCESPGCFPIAPAGQTNLADPLIEAFELKPDWIFIVSDGYENDPPNGAEQIASTYLKKIARVDAPQIVHINPVFDPDHFAPRPLGRSIATIGVRDAEDLGVMLEFAKFAHGKASLETLEARLLSLARMAVEQHD